MTAYVEREIGLQRATGDRYRIELSYRSPDGDASRHLAHDSSSQVQFNLPRLRELQFDVEAYGRHLSGNLFADPAVVYFLDQARSDALVEDAQVRLRLAIAPEAPELHNLCWEALCDPQEQFLRPGFGGVHAVGFERRGAAGHRPDVVDSHGAHLPWNLAAVPGLLLIHVSKLSTGPFPHP